MLRLSFASGTCQAINPAVELRVEPRLHPRLRVVRPVREAPETITPDDFRLRPDSAGYQAGKDKKELGADVDLVGPGAAYERWKKTPEYQQWLKDSGQVK